MVAQGNISAWSFISGFSDVGPNRCPCGSNIVLMLFHHLLVQTITVSLAVMINHAAIHFLLKVHSIVLIHYGVVKVVVVVKLLVVSILLFLGFISCWMILLLMLLR